MVHQGWCWPLRSLNTHWPPNTRSLNTDHAVVVSVILQTTSKYAFFLKNIIGQPNLPRRITTKNFFPAFSRSKLKQFFRGTKSCGISSIGISRLQDSCWQSETSRLNLDELTGVDPKNRTRTRAFLKVFLFAGLTQPRQDMAILERKAERKVTP